MSTNWKIENISDVPPKKSSYSKGWKSIRWYMGISAFGINAVTKNKNEALTPEHDEVSDNQEELFIIIEGSAEFVLDGVKQKTVPGDLIFVKPAVKRSAKALESPTTMVVIGAPINEVYKPTDWA